MLYETDSVFIRRRVSERLRFSYFQTISFASRDLSRLIFDVSVENAIPLLWLTRCLTDNYEKPSAA